MHGNGHEAPTTHSSLLVVDADRRSRALVRATLAILDVEVAEATSLAAASAHAALSPPAVVVLGADVGGDPAAFCRELAADARTTDVGVVVLGEIGALRRRLLREAGAAAVLPAPGRRVDLIEAVEGLLMRQLLRWAHRQPVHVLADALARKDTGTQAHSQRVDEYAKLLAAAIDPTLLADPGLESGFLLHDIGKIGIPDRILLKAGPLTDAEQRVMRTHTVLGEHMVAEMPLLAPSARSIVRSHHERWDGHGYPDGLAGDDIPLGARVFAVVDTLDAMTTERPYRRASSWPHAVSEIEREAGQQFDPEVVDAFLDVERDLRGIYHELAAA